MNLMFTGIIEEIGKVEGISAKGNGKRLIISCEEILKGIKTGDSIAVDGVCLTVEEFSNTCFTVFATAETLERSTLATIRTGNKLHLERALMLSARLGGHLVQGHVDAIGTIVRDQKNGDTLVRTITLANEYMKYIVEKGSIAIDGVSLTVASKESRDFTVVLIPETLKRTTLAGKKTGERVNIETDILAKYTESLLHSKNNGLTENKLKEHGF